MKNLQVYITAMLAVLFALIAWRVCVLLSWQGSWDRFVSVDRELRKYSSLSISFERSFDAAGGVIFRLPSIAADSSIVRGAFDRVLAECSQEGMVFTLVPSGESFRKDEKKVFRGFTGCSIDSGGAFVYMTCSDKKKTFSRIYTFENGFIPIPQGAK